MPILSCGNAIFTPKMGPACVRERSLEEDIISMEIIVPYK